MQEPEVEVLALEDLRLLRGRRATVLRAGDRVRLPLRKARLLVAQAPDSTAFIPTIAEGAIITWRSINGIVRGPVSVQKSFIDGESGRTWVLVTWADTIHLLREDLVIERELGQTLRDERGTPDANPQHWQEELF